MSKDIIQQIKENYSNIEKSIINQLFLKVSNHYLTEGTQREQVWMQLFRQIIPRKFAIEQSVFILDSKKNVSREVDLVVFDEQYTPYIFNYGNIRFVPIEAVAMVVQCKSTALKQDNLSDWVESLNLSTDSNSIVRMAHDVLIKNTPLTQSATRPLKVLCYLKDGNDSNKKKSEDLFDIVICADNQQQQLNIRYPDEKSLNDWYMALNHWGKEPGQIEKRYDKTDIGEIELDAYKVNDSNLLSLVFQLNQLLMLINNPMLFPHIAYVDFFNGKNG